MLSIQTNIFKDPQNELSIKSSTTARREDILTMGSKAQGISENIQSSLMMIRNVSNPERVSRRISLIGSGQNHKEAPNQLQQGKQQADTQEIDPESCRNSRKQTFGSNLGISNGIEQFGDIFGSDVGRETLKKDYTSTPFKYKDPLKKIEYSLTKKDLHDIEAQLGVQKIDTQDIAGIEGPIFRVNNVMVKQQAGNILKAGLNFKKNSEVTQLEEITKNYKIEQEDMSDPLAEVHESRKLNFSGCDLSSNESGERKDSMAKFFKFESKNLDTTGSKPKVESQLFEDLSQIDDSNPLYKDLDYQEKLKRELSLSEPTTGPFDSLKNAPDLRKLEVYEKQIPELRLRIKELFTENEDIKSQLRVKSKQNIELVYQSSAKNSNRGSMLVKQKGTDQQTQTAEIQLQMPSDHQELKLKNAKLLEQVTALKVQFKETETTVEKKFKFQIRKLEEENMDFQKQNKQQKETIVSNSFLANLTLQGHLNERIMQLETKVSKLSDMNSRKLGDKDILVENLRSENRRLKNDLQNRVRTFSKPVSANFVNFPSLTQIQRSKLYQSSNR